MGNRITFRGRGRGCTAESSGAVSITEPRVKFIRGWATGGSDPADGSVECGNGTAYPLEVTVAQLEEIFYRVRDAWFTSGSTYDAVSGHGTQLLGSGPDTGHLANYSSNDVAPDYHAITSLRGYVWVAADVPDESDAYFGALYTDKFFAPYYGTYTSDYRDASTELAMCEVDPDVRPVAGFAKL